MFQQLTGMNAIVFYSAQLFAPDPEKPDSQTVSPNVGSAILMSWNAVAAILGMLAASWFGRKTLMLVTNGMISIAMIAMWYLMMQEDQLAALIITGYIMLMFELGSGSIFWPYAAEICTDKGTALATVHVWFWTMIVGLLTPYMMEDWLPKGKTFIVFGVLSFLVSISISNKLDCVGDGIYLSIHEGDKGTFRSAS